MKQTKAIKLSYMAGFFDGEGCVTIVRQKPTGRQKSIRYQLHVMVGQKDGQIMDWIIGNFGGSVYKVSRDNSYVWQISQNKAYLFLKEILPFLKYKRPQAELGIRFMQRMINREATFSPVKGGKLSEHEIQIRESFCQQMNQLKRQFAGCSVDLKGAGVTTKCDDSQMGDAIV